MKKLDIVRRITLRLTKQDEAALLQIKKYYNVDKDTDVIRRLIMDKVVDISLDT